MIKNYLSIILVGGLLLSCTSESPQTAKDSKDSGKAETASAPMQKAADSEESTMQAGTGEGTISKLNLNGITIHSYTAPEDSEVVNSHIIETDNSLILIDMQFLRPYARQLAAYAAGLGKPIDRVIMTHHHPDHWFGYESFPAIPVYAQQEVVDGFNKMADFYIKARRKTLGELVPETKMIPGHIIDNNNAIIDGVQFEFSLINKAEAGAQTVISLPEYKVTFVGDLVAHNSHSFYGGGMAKPWVANLTDLAEKNQSEYILTGHGKPPAVDPSGFEWQITYLETTIEALQQDGPTETLAIIEAAYPDLGAKGMAALSANFFHGVVKPRMEKQKQEKQSAQ